MNSLNKVYICLLLAALFHKAAFAEGLTFGLIAKSIDDSNFIDAWHGCAEEAKRLGDECLLIGGDGAANPRLQLRAIEQASKKKHFDAFAISVTKSDFIAAGMRELSIPIITFDSPFDAHNAHLSRSYIGVDNVEFGRELARLAKHFRPEGGSICIMTAIHDSNLAQRVRGVRQELSGNTEFPDGRRLNGDGGWTENLRCPWNTADTAKRAMNQIEVTLNVLKPDVFISVGSWPLIDPELYRKTVKPFHKDLSKRTPVVIMAVGKILPEYTRLMNDQLVHGYVSINFLEIGRMSARFMRSVAEGSPIPSLKYIHSEVQTVE